MQSVIESTNMPRPRLSLGLDKLQPDMEWYTGFFHVTEDFVGWKKARMRFTPASFEQVIVKLTIPKGAYLYSPSANTNLEKNPWMGDAETIDARKCRADCAVVDGFYRFAKSANQFSNNCSLMPFELDAGHEVTSLFDHSFIYRKGNVIAPNFPFSKNQSQCDSGIHFFYDMRDAVDY